MITTTLEDFDITLKMQDYYKNTYYIDFLKDVFKYYEEDEITDIKNSNYFSITGNNGGDHYITHAQSLELLAKKMEGEYTNISEIFAIFEKINDEFVQIEYKIENKITITKVES